MSMSSSSSSSSTLSQNTDSTDSENHNIRVVGARVHNLKNVSLDIPREQMVVITGVSGSGKSSLAFDTIFAEGQRQYIESLSVYARQFFDQIERPDVDLIEGLQPTICINQHRGTANPRSTVATVTEISDYLRLLMARLGQVHCYRCGEAISCQSVEQIQQILEKLPQGTKAMILAPLVRGKKGIHKEVIASVRKEGYVRVRIDGHVYDIEHTPDLDPRRSHEIQSVIDRIIIKPGKEARLAEALQQAVKYGEGLLMVCTAEKIDGEEVWQEELFSTRYACLNCSLSYDELEPRSFSFNSPYGACPECAGLGKKEQFDPDLVVPDKSLSIEQGALLAWKVLTAAMKKKLNPPLEEFMAKAKFDEQTSLDQLREKVVEQLLFGNGKNGNHQSDFPGVLSLLEKQYVTTTNEKILDKLEAFRGEVVCPECRGARLRPEARNVFVGDLAIDQITALPIVEVQRFFEKLQFTEEQNYIAQPILQEINNRLLFLMKVGLGYLSLNRSADTLSGGEMQRVRLATGIGSGLVGVCYVLDEPSIGLHQRDNQRLIDALRDLQALGNSVLVVEHDEAMIAQADHLIDVGPTAGGHGGEIVAQGSPQVIAAHENSITGSYMSGRMKIEIPKQRRKIAKTRALQLQGCTHNNLKNLDVMFPLGVFTCISGVSGSGKSSLVNGTLVKAIQVRLNGTGHKPGAHSSLRGVSQIDKLVPIDQSPIGRTPRSNPATYTGAFDEIRKVFAATKEAKQRGYSVGRFSFNVKGGRCEACQGQGQQKIEMTFLPDFYFPCEECQGRRFNQATLGVKFRNHTISDVLEMQVEQAAELFENFPNIARWLNSLESVGLGYLTLGQSSSTLSGGEAQRIKLAAELGRVETGNTLYILDEPTTGLHFHDIKQLLSVLNQLVELGNSVLVIEHHLDVIKTADYVIDLGPEGGQDGGELMACGTPDEIASVENSHTGRFLRELLS